MRIVNGMTTKLKMTEWTSGTTIQSRSDIISTIMPWSMTNNGVENRFTDIWLRTIRLPVLIAIGVVTVSSLLDQVQ